MTVSEITNPLFTDLYELTMAAAYHGNRVEGEAVFSLFIRGYPPQRGFFVAAGLQDALSRLQQLKFSQSDLAYLDSTGLFNPDFIFYLDRFRFTGAVHAMPEGTLFFAGEPVLEVTAPIIEAQLIETLMLNTIGFQTLIATKAARCIHAAGGRPLVDFSLRRTQGWDAGMKVARSVYIAGFDATSNVLAGKRYGIPVSGTMAHSFVLCFDSESEAFSAYSKIFPENSVLLIDTYDTIEGAKNAANIALEMRRKGQSLVGVRLDSGDMVDLSRRVREILDEAGLDRVKIVASSGFDEFEIADALARGATIDAFGVGSKVGVSADAPFLDIVYKLVKFKGRGVKKLSPKKATLAGEKQVFRKTDIHNRLRQDVIGLRDEVIDGAIPLLEKVMEKGVAVIASPELRTLRERFQHNFKLLPETYKSIREPGRYPVVLSERLETYQNR